MRKPWISSIIFCLTVAVLFSLPLFTYAAEGNMIAAGSCGESLTWALYDNGDLKISGTGEMFDYDNQPTPWAEHCDKIRTVTLDNGVTKLGMYAFKECVNLTEVSMANTLEVLAGGAFRNCSALTQITVPDNVKLIENGVFSGCSALTDITVPFVGSSIKGELDSYQYPFGYIFGSDPYPGSSVVNQYYYGRSDYVYGSFYLPDSLKTVTVTGGEILVGAFENCRNVTTVTLPESATIIGNDAFLDCHGLTSIVIPDSVQKIGAWSFHRCYSLEYAKIGDGVTHIGDFAFRECPKLTEVEFGSGLNFIGEEAFFCSGLRSLTLPEGLTATGYNAFGGCGDLAEVHLPSTLLVIDAGSFTSCAFESIQLPESLTTIGQRAFASCVNLSGLEIPDKVTEIGDEAFRYCWELKTITLGNNLRRIGSQTFYDCDKLERITIPASVTEIGYRAFYDCYALEDVTVEADNEYYCSDEKGVLYDKGQSVLMFAPTSLTGAYRIPDSVMTIDDSAFRLCALVERIYLPEDLKEIGEEAFYCCSGLVEINIPEGVEKIGPWTFAQCDILPEIVIPDSVTEIGDHAFYWCHNLASVDLGSGITDIGESAFVSCQISSVDLPAGLRSIGSSAFRNCGHLDEILIPASVEHIGDGAFFGCNSLCSITVADENLFYSTDADLVLYDKNRTKLIFALSKLEGSFRVPDTVTDICDFAFYGSDITDIRIPGSVEVIGRETFSSCDKLEHVTLENGVLKIREHAFWCCTSLKKITIPETVEEIGWLAFSNCTAMEIIVFEGDAPVIDGAAFDLVAATAYYPADNATWTEEKRQNYGGTITWVPMEDEEHTVTWVSASTTLGGNIGLNFYVKLSNSLVAEESTFMRFLVDGVTIDVPFGQAIKSTGSDGLPQYRFTCPVSAKNMTDVVTAQVMTKDGAVGDSKSLAVVTYCNFMIQNSTDEKLTGLMKAMLNYGAAAQVLFNHNTDNLANAALSEVDKTLADVDASQYGASISGSEQGIALSSATLLLETETTARIYFKLTGDKTIEEFTFFVDGEEVVPQQKGGEYYVEIPDIAAQDLDQMHTVTVGGLTVNYAGLSYVATVLKNPDIAGEALVNTAKALFAYNKLAESYFNG